MGGVRLCMLLVALLVWVLQLFVQGVGLGVVGCWVLLDAGPRHSMLRACWVALQVGLPVCSSGVSGGSSPLLAEGPGRCFLSFLCGVFFLGWPWVPRHSWLRVVGFFRGFLCCVRLWCVCVLCVFVALLLVAAVVVCVACARVRVWCVGDAFGCLPSTVFAWVRGSVWVWGCVLWSLACPGWGAWVWFPATPGLALVVVVRSAAAALRALSPLPLGCVALRAAPLVSCAGLPGLWWVCGGVGWGGGGPSRWLGSLPLVFPLWGADACIPRQVVTLLYGPSICTCSIQMDLLRSQVVQPFPQPGSGTLWVTGESLRDRRVLPAPMDGVPYLQPLPGHEPQYVPWGVFLVRPIGHPPPAGATSGR